MCSDNSFFFCFFYPRNWSEAFIVYLSCSVNVSSFLACWNQHYAGRNRNRVTAPLHSYIIQEAPCSLCIHDDRYSEDPSQAWSGHVFASCACVALEHVGRLCFARCSGEGIATLKYSAMTFECLFGPFLLAKQTKKLHTA